LQKAVHRHQVDVDGVEHQLNAHQQSDSVSAGQNAVNADSEKDCR
jgi:hypothetical protein